MKPVLNFNDFDAFLPNNHYEDTIFKHNPGTIFHYFQNITFKNCIFINCCILPSRHSRKTFQECTFINCNISNSSYNNYIDNEFLLPRFPSYDTTIKSHDRNDTCRNITRFIDCKFYKSFIYLYIVDRSTPLTSLLNFYPQKDFLFINCNFPNSYLSVESSLAIALNIDMSQVDKLKDDYSFVVNRIMNILFFNCKLDIVFTYLKDYIDPRNPLNKTFVVIEHGRDIRNIYFTLSRYFDIAGKSSFNHVSNLYKYNIREDLLERAGRTKRLSGFRYVDEEDNCEEEIRNELKLYEQY